MAHIDSSIGPGVAWWDWPNDARALLDDPAHSFTVRSGGRAAKYVLVRPQEAVTVGGGEAFAPPTISAWHFNTANTASNEQELDAGTFHSILAQQPIPAAPAASPASPGPFLLLAAVALVLLLVVLLQ